MHSHILHYDIHEIAPYINWVYFYHAWQVRDKDEQLRLRKEAEERLVAAEGQYRAHSIVVIGEANSDDDDIVFEGTRIPTLRQQKKAIIDTLAADDPRRYNLALADFIRPLSSGIADTMGIFAASVDEAMERSHSDNDYESMMHKLLADRLAEAAIEKTHETVRKQLWGYAPNEDLSISDMHAERFVGIRPAVGYPSLPDQSINIIIGDFTGCYNSGIRLTENGAMIPHASVSGLIIAHPRACYFSVGPINNDQLLDYAYRRGMTLEEIRHFLGSNI